MNDKDRVLVTGGCGFIGAHFLQRVVPAFPRCTFVNLDLESVFSHTEALPESVRFAPNYHFTPGNVSDFALVSRLMQQFGFTTIVHFAAHSHVDSSFECGEDVLRYTSDNVGGTHVLLEAARRLLCDPLILHFSTDEVYGDNSGQDPHTEGSTLRPTNPYAASKACAEMYVCAYTRSYSTRAVIVRCNNVFGPGQHRDKLIPKFLAHLKRNEPCPVHGSGRALRSFVYIDDVVDAVLLLLRCGSPGAVYNLEGPAGNEKSVLEVARALLARLGLPEAGRLEFVPDRPYNDRRYLIDGSKARALGWEPRVSFEEGLDRVLRTELVGAAGQALAPNLELRP